VKTKTVAEGFEMLKAGQVDALASDRTALVGTFLQSGGAEGLGVFGEDLSYEPYALVMRKGDPEFRSAGRPRARADLSHGRHRGDLFALAGSAGARLRWG
jgi:hypothetical protein